MDIYKRLGDVPPERRFETDTEPYEGDETYCQFLETSSLPRIDSDRAAQNARLAGHYGRHRFTTYGGSNGSLSDS